MRGKPAKERISSFRCARPPDRSEAVWPPVAFDGPLRQEAAGMNPLSISAASTGPPIDGSKDAFDRLTFLGWRGGLAAIVAGLAASFFLYGYALIYWRNADMDFMVIYNALALNDGKPQLFFDHTAYITILSLKLWFQLLHAVGLLDAWSLSSIPSAADPSKFEAAMTGAVRAGRLLAFAIATGCVLIFAGLARRI